MIIFYPCPPCPQCPPFFLFYYHIGISLSIPKMESIWDTEDTEDTEHVKLNCPSQKRRLLPYDRD